MAQVRNREPLRFDWLRLRVLLRLLIEELCELGRFSLRGVPAEGSHNCAGYAFGKWGGS